MRHQVLVDSRDRDFELYPEPNRYRIRLPRRYTNVVAARVLSADVPLSFFVFKAEYGNTTLRVGLGAGAPLDVTLRDGNYDDQTVLEELGAALAAAFPGKSFKLEIDARTYQLVIACVEGDTVAVDTTAYPADQPAWTDWSLAYYLGFPKGALTSGAPLRSPGMINLNPVTYILLDIEELGVVDEGGMYGGATGKGCFCKIPVQGISYEYIFRDVDRATELVSARSLVPRLETLTISFRTHGGRAIDFRGIEHSLLLEIVTRDPPCYPGALASLAPVLRSAEQPQPDPEDSPPPPAPPPPPPPPRRVPRPVYFAGAVAVAGGAWWWWSRRAGGAAGPAAPAVVTGP